MPALQCSANTFIDRHELHQLLLEGQQNCLKNNCQQVLSISLKISPVDPLLVLQKLAVSDQITFYFENKDKQEAIAAIGAVAKLEIESKERFSTAQKFINACLANTLILGTRGHRFTGPHFFCSFKFFDEPSLISYPFPACTVFLPRWQIARHHDDYILVGNILIEPGVNINKVLQDFTRDIQSVCSSDNIEKINEEHRSKIIREDASNTESYKNAVFSCLELIQKKALSKIVIAQTLNVKSDLPLNIFQALKKLRKLYSNCYTFSISNGKGQNFIGASPEQLISIRNNQLMTDALAGSAPRGKTATEDIALANFLLNSEKERREHQAVVDFMTHCLHQLDIVPNLLKTRLRQLSNIQHLWTPIQAQVPLNVHPLEIVAALHPTPAVAGVDREIACREIRRYENFERGLYAAPLGWVDYRGNSEFIVGIRSALIDGDRARLYAGAGIVAGSHPDKELAEIQLKLQALLKVLV